MSNTSFAALNARAILVPPAVYRPGWPHPPNFLDFPDDQTLNAVNTAFLECFYLAAAALQALALIQLNIGARTLPAHTQSFRRYFQPDQLCDVQNAFIGVLGGPGGKFGPSTMPQLLSVRYDHLPATPGAIQCYNTPRLRAYLADDPSTGAADMVICPELFNPPGSMSTQALLGRKLDDDDPNDYGIWECPNLRGYAWRGLRTPAGTVLHELLR